MPAKGNGDYPMSNNRNLRLCNTHIQSICSLLQDIADANSFKTCPGIYQLTVSSEETYADIPSIAAE